MTAVAEINTRFNPAPRPAAVSQATAIEQSRAIAEVQASVVVAQNCPRDMASAEAEMEYVCGRLDMAEQAFYQVDNRGTGPSVHLMRELARIWGNVDYGVKELHRDDEAGESEVQAFAWDIQKNTRSSRTFINPHARMKGKGAARARVQLVDLTDIYLSNQNIGARAVRECIATILPRWFTEKAQEICRGTLENGEGEPLQDRIARLIDWFGQMDVSLAQLEARVGKKRGAWDAQDVAQFQIAGKSIRAGEASKDELFPPVASSTADEIADAAAPSEDSVQAARTELEGEVVAAAQAADAAEQNSGQADEPEPAPPADEPKQQPRRGKAAAPAKSGATEQLQKTVRDKLNANIFAVFGELKLGGDKQREDRLIVIRSLLGYPELQSTKDLTDTDLQNLRNMLVDRQKAGVLDSEVTEILNASTLAEESKAAAAEGDAQ